MNLKMVPVLSRDLLVQKFSKDKYLLHQSKYGHYIKVSKNVHQLICLMDGKLDLETISEEYNNKYDGKITPKFIYNLFADKFGKYGLLSNFDYLAAYAEKPDYLKLSFILIDKKILAKITPLFGVLFNPKMMKILFGLSFILSLFTLTYNFSEIRDFFYMFIPDLRSMVIFFGIMFVSVTLHEFGHASAASRFGAKHGGIGGGFYLFTPVYFADVTDIWKLPSKQRIVVNLAGVYFELLFCGLLCVLSIIFETPRIGVMAFIVFLYSLYNLIPFARSDGYWILADALDIPNLSKNANQSLLHWSKSVFTSEKYNYSPSALFLLIYGFINKSFIIFFVISVLFYDASSVFYFPYNLYSYVGGLIGNPRAEFFFGDLKQFVVPVVFYVLVFRYLKGLYLKFGNFGSF